MLLLQVSALASLSQCNFSDAKAVPSCLANEVSQLSAQNVTAAGRVEGADTTCALTCKLLLRDACSRASAAMYAMHFFLQCISCFIVAHKHTRIVQPPHVLTCSGAPRTSRAASDAIAQQSLS